MVLMFVGLPFITLHIQGMACLVHVHWLWVVREGVACFSAPSLCPTRDRIRVWCFVADIKVGSTLGLLTL